MKIRRRRYIVDLRFQWRFVIGFLTAALVGSVAATVIFNFFANKRLEEIRWSVFLNAKSTGEVLKPIFIYVNLFSFVFMSVLLLITMAWMMNKMRGPIYRIIKGLKLIRDGDFSDEIILRRKDEFKETASALNEMQNKMKERFSEFKLRYEEISQALIELEVAHAKGVSINDKSKEIIAMIKKLRQKILPDPIKI